MGVEENFLNEIISKKREKGYAKIGSSVYHLDKQKRYTAIANINFTCNLQDFNTLLNEIITDLNNEKLEVNITFY